MKFNERLKELREKNQLTQEQLARKSDVSSRMIQRYEYGKSRPRLDAAEKIASALGVTTDELLGNSGRFESKATEKYGTRVAKQAHELADELSDLFTGGELAEEDLDVMMKAVQDAYWIAKEKNKKYTQQKYWKNE